MSATNSDQEIVTLLAEKTKVPPKKAIFDGDGNLVELDFSGLNLSLVPCEIGQFTKLKVLNLSDNLLSQLPAEIGLLTSLQQLDLNYNKLSQLPAEIGQLTNLRELYLHNNELSQLPVEIGQLTSLRELNLNNNELSQLPVEISQLTSLRELHLEDNPSLFIPPPEIVLQGTSDILIFLQELQKSSFIRYESKLLIVGEGGTGKSSLLRALRNDKFDPHLQTTHGISVSQLKLPHPHHDLTLNIWDFGGQHIYHATHQFFLTQRSLYIVVWNARLEAGQGRLDYWLDTIN